MLKVHSEDLFVLVCDSVFCTYGVAERNETRVRCCLDMEIFALIFCFGMVELRSDFRALSPTPLSKGDEVKS